MRIITTTTSTIQGYFISEYIDTVCSNIVLGANIISDFVASITDIVGGKSGTYQNKLNIIYDDVISDITNKAIKIGANAIIGLRIDFDEISGGGKSMFMVSASGTAVKINKDIESRYSMYKLLYEIHNYKIKGFLSEEEYYNEKKIIVDNYKTSISEECQVIKDIKEQEKQIEKEIKIKIEKAKQELKNRCLCSEESILNTTFFQIQVANYESIPYNNKESLEVIIAKFIRINKIPEACKYYMDETGLDEKDAIEFVLDTYKRIDNIDKTNFDRLLNKIKILKRKGFIEQAISEYSKYTLVDKEQAKEFINTIN